MCGWVGGWGGGGREGGRGAVENYLNRRVHGSEGAENAALTANAHIPFPRVPPRIRNFSGVSRRSLKRRERDGNVDEANAAGPELFELLEQRMKHEK